MALGGGRSRATRSFDPDSDLERRVGVGEYRGLTFYEVNAKRIINKVPEESRMPFRYTINAYRGCSHACRYCFPRPTHEYLGFNLANDFDSRIVVKVNAVARVAPNLHRGNGAVTRSRWGRTRIPTKRPKPDITSRAD